MDTLKPNTGRDPHKVEAARIFDTCVDKVTPMQREYAKIATYAQRYGATTQDVRAWHDRAKQHR